MKKFTTLLCVALMVCLMVSSIAYAEPTTIRVSAWGSQLRTELTQAALDYYSSEHPDVAFEYEAYDYASYSSVIATRAATGDLPDMMQAGSLTIAPWVESGLLLDLAPYIESGALDLSDIPQAYIDNNRHGDSVYAVPIGFNCPVILYNADAVKEAGVELTNETSWEEFIEICKIMYEKTGMKADVGYYRDDTLMWVRARDHGYQLYENGTLGVPDASVFEEIYRFFLEGSQEGWHISPEVYVEITPGNIETDPIITKANWCTYCASNQISTFANSVGDAFELGMIAFPSANPVQTHWLKESQSMTVSSTCQNVDIAIDVLNYWMNSIEFNTLLKAERGVPASVIVASEMAKNMDKYAAMANNLVSYIAVNSSPIDLVYPGGATAFTTLYKELTDEVMYGETTPEEAAQRLYTEGLKCFE